MKLISVIIPTKNRPEFLKVSLQIFRQFSKEFEVIIIDNRSSAKISKLNKKYCEMLDNCKYKFVDDFCEVSESRNYGFSISTGDYIWFLDDDDLPPRKTIIDLLKIIKELSNDQVILLPSICKFGDILFDYKLPLKEISNFEFFRDKGHIVNTSCAIFPRGKLLEIKGWDKSLVAGQDTDLFLRISQIAKFKCLRTKPVIINVGHSNRISRKFFRQQYGKIQFLKKHWNILTAKRKFYYIVTFILCAPLFHGIKLRIKLLMLKRKK